MSYPGVRGVEAWASGSQQRGRALAPQEASRIGGILQESETPSPEGEGERRREEPGWVWKFSVLSRDPTLGQSS